MKHISEYTKIVTDDLLVKVENHKMNNAHVMEFKRNVVGISRIKDLLKK